MNVHPSPSPRARRRAVQAAQPVLGPSAGVGLTLPGATAAEAALGPPGAQRVDDPGPDISAPATRLLLRSTRRALAARWPTSPLATASAAARARARLALEAVLGQSPARTGGCESAARHGPAVPPPAWSAPHLAGFLDAAQAGCLALPSREPVVVMASSGGPRQLPVLTPLLALWLAREGVRVLLHGPLSDPLGVTSAEVLLGLGLTPAAHAADVTQAWARREPAFMATTQLCPALGPVLQRAHGAAWRSLARRLVRLLNPVVGARVLLVAHQGSHESAQTLARWAEAEGAALMLLRGAEGEPVADLRLRPRIDSWLGGAHQPGHSCQAQRKGMGAPPLWPQQADAAATALYAQAVLSGERPAPPPLAAQVALILGLLPRLQEPLRRG